ncbi:FAD-dependent oxidoreductase [Streptomyces sp. NPDC015232]|uniref:FAD-dependent oxidoreductase n=1 Tax=unclassified Streptomyces TaxID=2593676 RepID=UPI0036F4E31C
MTVGESVRRAVVMGGSYAGLFAARVLSEWADEVVVLEADDIGADGTGRLAPQRRQLHALLAMGHAQLERWFPGITAELVASGARLGEGADVRFHVDGRLKAPAEGTRMLGVTRPFLEAAVRRRVGALPGVRLVRGQARGLVLAGGRVRGVRTAEGDVLDADFAVDAMGRSSRLGHWLAEAGWLQAPVERMRIDLGYATALFRRGDELGTTVVAHNTPGPASGYRPTLCEPGALAAVEGDRWSVVLAGYAGHRPGADPKEFLARMRRGIEPLRTVAEACEMTGEVATFHFRESVRRVHARLDRFPGGLVVAGDALASVNPVYGQGLTLAALQANSLAAHLRSGTDPAEPAWGYFRRAAVVVDAAWQLSTTADLAQPHVTGPYPPGYRLLRWAGDRITEASVLDSEVNTTYLNVVNLIEHPRALTRPSVLLRAARVLLAAGRGR